MADKPTAPVSVRSHPSCLDHHPGLGHPETPERLTVVLDALTARAEGRWVVDRESPLQSTENTLGGLAWIHDPEYVERVREASEKGGGWLDSHDCGVSPGTFSAAVAASGIPDFSEAALGVRWLIVPRTPGLRAHRPHLVRPVTSRGHRA